MQQHFGTDHIACYTSRAWQTYSSEYLPMCHRANGLMKHFFSAHTKLCKDLLCLTPRCTLAKMARNEMLLPQLAHFDFIYLTWHLPWSLEKRRLINAGSQTRLICLKGQKLDIPHCNSLRKRPPKNNKPKKSPDKTKQINENKATKSKTINLEQNHTHLYRTRKKSVFLLHLWFRTS